MGNADLSRRGVRPALTPVLAVLAPVARSVLVAACCLVAFSVLPMAAGWRPYVVLSGSMSPQVQAGDVVVAAPVAAAAVMPGHVVVVVDPAQPQRLLVHRVVGRNSDGSFTTKGDANATADSAPVPPEAVRGLARLRIPAIGLPPYWSGAGAWRPLGSTVAGLSLLMVIASAAPPADRTGGSTPRADAGRRERGRRRGARRPRHAAGGRGPVRHGRPGGHRRGRRVPRHDAGPPQSLNIQESRGLADLEEVQGSSAAGGRSG